jgi:hypothetical protein
MRLSSMSTNRSFQELKALYLLNAQNGRHVYDGFSTDEIAAYNRRLMFGENDEAFPGAEEWSRIVD